MGTEGKVCRCAGVILRNPDRKILLLDRREGVLGWACPAGHYQENELGYACMVRELEEETGICKMALRNITALFNNCIGNPCNRGAKFHKWAIFTADIFSDRVELREPDKHKGIGWFSWDEIEVLNLEPVWRGILRELHRLNRI